MTSSYPGTDPDDPFSRPPNETGSRSAAPSSEETAPIRPDEPGYWEKRAQGETPPAYQPTPPTPPTPQAAPYGQPEQPYAQQPYAPYGQQPYAHPAYGTGYPGYAGYTVPNQPQATTAMVLGLVSMIGGFLTCGLLWLLAPVALVMGVKSRRAINQSEGRLGGAGNAQIGFVTGIIGTVLLVLALIAVVVLVVVLVAAVPDSSSTTYGTTV